MPCLPPGPVNPYLIGSPWLWYFGGLLGLHNFYLGRPVLGGEQIGSMPFMLAMILIGKWIGGGTIAGEAACVIGFGAFGAMVVVTPS